MLCFSCFVPGLPVPIWWLFLLCFWRCSQSGVSVQEEQKQRFQSLKISWTQDVTSILAGSRKKKKVWYLLWEKESKASRKFIGFCSHSFILPHFWMRLGFKQISTCKLRSSWIPNIIFLNILSAPWNFWSAFMWNLSQLWHVFCKLLGEPELTFWNLTA